MSAERLTEDEVQRLLSEVRRRGRTIAQQDRTIKRLREEVEWLRRNLYGRYARTPVFAGDPILALIKGEKDE